MPQRYACFACKNCKVRELIMLNAHRSLATHFVFTFLKKAIKVHLQILIHPFILLHSYSIIARKSPLHFEKNYLNLEKQTLGADFKIIPWIHNPCRPCSVTATLHEIYLCGNKKKKALPCTNKLITLRHGLPHVNSFIRSKI